VSELSRQAADIHRAGNLDAARGLYEKILRIDRRHINSLTNLGTIHLQNGNYSEAACLIGASVEINPGNL
jgi:tetratricopeptide (TPR) repeat protein